jgi:hypothetical protein
MPFENHLMNKPQEVDQTSATPTSWSNRMKLFSAIGCLCLIFTTGTGCSSLSSTGNHWNPLKPLSAPQESQTPVEPASMAVVWKDSVYEQPGVPSVKGFGGRFFIYDAQNNPIKSDGELIVYGYDESNPIHSDGSHTGADKKFVFPSDKFQHHFSDSDLGASYSVWIPWEKVGGPRKSITLIPIFKTNSGNVLRCGQSLVVLPGRTPQTANASTNGSQITNTPNLVAQASFQQPIAEQSNGHISQVSANTDILGKKSGIRTTTFSLPPSLGKKMSANPAPFKAPTENSFPRPNQSAEPNGTAVTPSVASNEANDSAADLPQPAPRIFGMPGSF